MEIKGGVHMDTNRLRGEIAARYKTQSAFADAINWNKNKVTNLLKGTYKPSIDDVVKIAEKKGIKIIRNLIGNYVTSIDMAGASISLMKVNDDILKLWDYPVYTAALRWGM